MGELTLGPVRSWTAPVNTDRPAVGEAPAADWVAFGEKKVAEASKILLDRMLTEWIPAGEGMPTEIYSKGFMCTVTLVSASITVPEIGRALGLETIQADAAAVPPILANPNAIEFDFVRRTVLADLALLVRGQSPADRDLGKAVDFYLPAVQFLNPVELSVGTDAPSTIAYLFRAMKGDGVHRGALEQEG